MSAECHVCGRDIEYPAGTWPLGECTYCAFSDRAEKAEAAARIEAKLANEEHARAVKAEAALRFWVERADRFEQLIPLDRQYMRARGVLSPQYAAGRALAVPGDTPTTSVWSAKNKERCCECGVMPGRPHRLECRLAAPGDTP